MLNNIRKTHLLYKVNIILTFILVVMIFLYIKLSYLPITKDYLMRKYQLEKWHALVNEYIDLNKQFPNDLKAVVSEINYLPYLEAGQLRNESKEKQRYIQDPNKLLEELKYVFVSGGQDWYIIEYCDTRNKSRMFIDKEGTTYVTRILIREE